MGKLVGVDVDVEARSIRFVDQGAKQLESANHANINSRSVFSFPPFCLLY